MVVNSTLSNSDAIRAAPVILVVDDDDYVHGALEAALRSLRPTIVRATSAAEGLERARAERPDLAIVDLGLPDQDGYSLTRSLRAEPDLAHLRILILTGHEPDQATALAAGADAIMSKPFRLHEFLARVETFLRGPALA